MCGIACYIGKKIPLKTVIEDLKKLEYRGYDSAGVAYYDDGGISTIKAVGRIQNLEDKLGDRASNVIISHTRWATHGKVTEANAHPQVSYGKEYAVVHNGIIENYQELKHEIGEDKFSSQTDTEVIANLLETLGPDALQSLSKAVEKLNGSYALAVIDKTGNKMLLAKNKSPLYVAKVGDGWWSASDISCFDGADEYYALDDGTIAEIDNDHILFYSVGQKISEKPCKMPTDFEAVRLGGYQNYMQKEIAETPRVIKNICTRYKSLKNELLDRNLFEGIEQIYLIGCGTAYHACAIGAKWIEKNTHIITRAEYASEFRYSSPLLSPNTLIILVSQSGETADTLAVGQMTKAKGAKVYAITNVEYSSITKLADKTFPLCAGPEIAVASTKAYSAMLSVLYILSHYKQDYSFTEQELLALADTVLDAQVKPDLIDRIIASPRVFFIGRGADGITSNEGALKLKEISYLDASGYYAGELKHGTIALVEPGVVVIAIITDPAVASKTLNAVKEVESRGAHVVVVTTMPEICPEEDTIAIKSCGTQELDSIMAILPLQKLAYLVTKKLGRNPDLPRNLAKSVTVE